MQALVFTAAGRVELRDEPDPHAADGQVVMQVRASGVCGSELHGFRTTTFRKPPMIMGHEFAGTVDGGARVVVNPLLSCGTCASCRVGRPQVCAERQLLGVHRPGGFAEYVAVPRSSLHALPDGIGWAAATLIEPLANAVHACSLVATLPDELAIIGAGPIGLVCALVARSRGAHVRLFETSPGRRALAARLGFDTHAGLDEGDVFEVVLDAVGSQQTRDAALQHSAPGGTAIWLGLADDTVEVEGNAIVRGEKRVFGSFAYRPDEFAAAVELASSLDLSWTTDVPLTESEGVFYALAAGESEIVKAVLVPGGSVS